MIQKRFWAFSRTHGVALCVLLLVTLIYCWPLIRHLQTAIPGTANDHDVATMVWNTGWVTEALHSGKDLLHTDAVLIPFGADLRLHTYGLLQGLMAYPFTSLLGVVGAFNLILILNLFLNGAVLYALIFAETQHSLAALLAAVWVMLSSPVAFQFAVGRPSFGAIWIVAGALLALRSLFNNPRIWKGILLGSFLILALLSDFQIVLYTSIWLGFYALYRLWRDHRKIFELWQVICLTVAVLVFLIPFMLIFYPALSNGAGFQQPVLEGMVLFSFRPWDYTTPQTIALVYAYELLLAGLVAPFVLRRREGYRFWLGSAIFIFILALGPFLQLPSGITTIKLPFALLSLWPPLRQFRTPYRLAIPAQLGLGVSAGFLLAYLLPRIRSHYLLWGAVAFAIGVRLILTINHDPMQVQTYPTYAIYQQIASEPGSFTLLEVPFGVRSGLDRIGDRGEILEYYQHIHGKNLLNGMIARLPVSVFAFYRESPLLLLLSGELVGKSDAVLDADFADVLNWSGTHYVLLHRDLLSDQQFRRIEPFLNRQLQLEQVDVENDLIIYRVIIPNS